MCQLVLQDVSALPAQQGLLRGIKVVVDALKRRPLGLVWVPTRIIRMCETVKALLRDTSKEDNLTTRECISEASLCLLIYTPTTLKKL